MTQATRMLLSEGLITAEQLDRAQGRTAAKGGSLCHHLVEGGAIGPEELVRFLVRRFPLQRWSRGRLEIVPPAALSAVPAAHARSLRVLPVSAADGRVTLALVDPTDTHAIRETARAAGAKIDIVLVSDADLSFALDLHYGGGGFDPALDDGVPLPLVSKAPGPPVVAEEAIPLVHRARHREVVAVPDGDSWSIEPSAPPSARGASSRPRPRRWSRPRRRPPRSPRRGPGAKAS